MSAVPGSLGWFARHELLLHWRELTALLFRGDRRRTIAIAITFAIIAIIAHGFAELLIGPWARAGTTADLTTLAQLTATGLLFALMSLSQAMESVCRAYYTRADLDLILSSPASSQRLFIVRTATIGLTSALLMSLLISPIINVLAFHDGAHWLSAYLVIAALSLITTALAVVITLALFRVLGPKRTRIVSQVLAAIIGAALVVGIQLAIIMGTGQIGGIRDYLIASLAANAADPASFIWLPAHAAMGQPAALLTILIIAAAALGIVLPWSGRSFARLATAASSLSNAASRPARAHRFRHLSAAAALRQKEWRLIRRDPWLISQSLMQLFYMLPPAALLWVQYGSSANAIPIAAGIITMAAGQLAGGLAWITISGEDAHDFVATAPISPRRMLIAKIEAVLVIVACVAAPLVLGIAILSPAGALTTAIGIGIAAISAVFIQLMFRSKAKRSQFARRQTASRFATISEAFVSIAWAGATGLAIFHWVFGLLAALPALMVLLAVWLTRRNAQFD